MALEQQENKLGSNIRRRKVKDDSLKRVHRQSLMFNKREMRAINRYCARYKVANKSKFMRETIITTIIKKFDEDYPSLFEDTPNLFTAARSRK